jgi:Rrf2 family protein
LARARVGGGDLRVVGVEHGVLEVPLEEDARMGHEVLVEGVGLGDQRDRGVPHPAHAAAALPGRDLAARVADEDAHVEAAHVDPHLEGRRRDDALELAREQAALDLASLGREEAGAVGAHAVFQRGLRFDHPGVHELGDDAGLRERDGAQAAADRAAEQASGQRVGGRRGPEQQHVAFGAGRPVALDRGDGASRERLGELPRIGHGGGCRYDARACAVEVRDAIEPAQHLGDVRPEDSAVGVELVDHHEAQVLEQGSPRAVMGEDAGVQHVRRRDEHGRRLVAQLAPGGLGRVSVVHRDAQVDPAQGGDVGLEAPALVAGEGLERKQVEGARVRILHGATQHGQVVDQALAARGGGGEHHVVALLERLDRPLLVDVEVVDSASLEDRRQRFEPLGQLERERWGLGGQHRVVDQRLPEVGVGLERLDERTDLGHAIPHRCRAQGRVRSSARSGRSDRDSGGKGGSQAYPGSGTRIKGGRARRGPSAGRRRRSRFPTDACLRATAGESGEGGPVVGGTGVRHAGPVRFSLQVQYAICGVFDIAYNGQGAPVQIRVISERQVIPARYLEQIFQRLRRADLVTSKRGPGGGYTLSRPPSEISLREVVEAVEGSFAEAVPMNGGKPAEGDAYRPDFLWAPLAQRIGEALAETTIETLCRDATDADVPRAESEAPMYFI